MKKGEVQEAIKLYRMILQSFPHNKRVQKLLTNLAKRSLIKASITPTTDIINQIAIKYKQGQLKYVAERASILVKQYPKAHVILNTHGAALAGLGNNSEAEAAFEEVTKLEPTEAFKAYKKALTIIPNYAEAYNNMATAFKGIGQLEDAIAAYNKALELKPNYAAICNNLGIVLRYQKKIGEICFCF